MIRKITRNLLPPVICKLLKTTRNLMNLSGASLFDGDDKIFKDLVGKAGVYAEYGCGASTIWVASNVNCKIYSVDSSKDWITTVNQKCSANKRLKLHHADVGKVKEWGRPINYEKINNFKDYTDWIWKQGELPDVVLIDGRFRVCCFLVSLLNASPGTSILFDDYKKREHYHFVERFLQPVRWCGRQALFVVPAKEKLEIQQIVEAICRFRFVMD